MFIPHTYLSSPDFENMTVTGTTWLRGSFFSTLSLSLTYTMTAFAQV